MWNFGIFGRYDARQIATKHVTLTLSEYCSTSHLWGSLCFADGVDDFRRLPNLSNTQFLGN